MPTVEQTLMTRWEVAKDDDDALTWVAATAEWLRPAPPGTSSRPSGPTGKRFVLDRPELRFVVIKRLLERMSRDRPVLLWLDDLHSPRRIPSRCSRASGATRANLRLLHRR